MMILIKDILLLCHFEIRLTNSDHFPVLKDRNKGVLARKDDLTLLKEIYHSHR